MSLRSRFAAFFGGVTLGEHRALHLVEIWRRIVSRQREAAGRLVGVAATSDVVSTDQGVVVLLPAGALREYLRDQYGDDHPFTLALTERIAVETSLRGIEEA